MTSINGDKIKKERRKPMADIICRQTNNKQTNKDVKEAIKTETAVNSQD